MGRPFSILIRVLALCLTAGAIDAQTSSVTVTLSTSSNTLQANATANLSALVTGATNLAVNWTVSPQIGTLGTSSVPAAGGRSTNTYTAPATITIGQSVTITATSQQDPTASDSVKIAFGSQLDVGTGAPTGALQQQFIQAYFRNGFNNQVSLPPSGQVTALGSTGYIQLFNDAAKTGTTWALASQSTTTATSVSSVVQIFGGMYSYFNSLGVAATGYPLYDTASCGTVQGSACLTQTFDKGYALFYYLPALAGGSGLNVSGSFYTLWTRFGPGPPLTAQTAITAPSGIMATAQTYLSGAIYSITSGTNKGQLFAVTEPLYDSYVSRGGAAGNLGLPTNQLLTLPAGVLQQSFEGGTLEYVPGTGTIVLLPVSQVVLTGSPGVPAGASIQLNLGQTLTVTATPYDTAGMAATDRPVAWTSSNGKVIAISANGGTAVLTAAGGGSATVAASAGGIVSAKLSFVVTAPCCQVGDGAPPAVAQAFQSALVRAQISVVLPVQAPAARVGNGYAQMVQAAGSAGSVYLIAGADQSGSAYVVGGAVLARYQALGGPAGALGYPVSDQSAGGTQRFVNGALAGNPVRVVSGAILAKWAALNYENGAGPPVSDAAAFATFAASSGNFQSFANTDIYAAAAGPHAGQAWSVSGLILTAFNAGGGASGALGMPVTDEFVTGGAHQQNFEGGYLTYASGAAAATVNLAPRTPAVTVAPSSIAAGGTVQFAVYGFAGGSTIQVSVTGQPNFTVAAANGAYSWSMFVPLTAPSGTLAIHATDGKGAAADGSLAIRGFDRNRVQLTMVGGNGQSGPPGAMLPVPLQVQLADASGVPVTGAPVIFEASPGAQVSAANAVTDSNGRAAVYLRLPAAAGVAEVTAGAPSIALTPVTFGVVVKAQQLANFPNLQQSGSTLLGKGPATIGQKGALLTAVSAILQFRQNRGEVASPNGPATPVALNQFLNSYCVAATSLCDGFLTSSGSAEQIVNLWRAAEFTGGLDVQVSSASPAAVADGVARGEPLLLSLALTLNGAAMGGHFVVATGINADGSIAIADPNPLFARTNLNDYLNGFSVGGSAKWQGSLLGVARLAVTAPSPTRFLLGALSQPAELMQGFTLTASSAVGPCGTPLVLLDLVGASGNAPSSGPLVSKLLVCDGLQPQYQIDVGAGQPYHAFATDLAAGGASTDLSGSAPATYSASRPQLSLVLAPQSAGFTANGVVNAATFAAGIAPGGLFAIFGSGLSGAASSTAVDFDGAPATVLAATPFQVNAQVPPSVTRGQHTLRLRSPFGTEQQPVMVSALAPAIFLIGNPPVGAVENQDGTLNGPANPVSRGQALVVYATGLGSVTAAKNGLSTVDAAVSVILNGTELPAAYAGLAPGFIGLYQINVVIPAPTPPGSGIFLTLKQGAQLSNAVNIAVR